VTSGEENSLVTRTTSSLKVRGALESFRLAKRTLKFSRLLKRILCIPCDLVSSHSRPTSSIPIPSIARTARSCKDETGNFHQNGRWNHGWSNLKVRAMFLLSDQYVVVTISMSLQITRLLYKIYSIQWGFLEKRRIISRSLPIRATP